MLHKLGQLPGRRYHSLDPAQVCTPGRNVLPCFAKNLGDGSFRISDDTPEGRQSCAQIGRPRSRCPSVGKLGVFSRAEGGVRFFDEDAAERLDFARFVAED